MTRVRTSVTRIHKAIVRPADVIPYLGRGARIEDGLVVTHCDTVYTLREYLRMRRYRTSEKRKAYDVGRHREWVERNRDHVRAYQRDYKRRHRADQRREAVA